LGRIGPLRRSAVRFGEPSALSHDGGFGSMQCHVEKCGPNATTNRPSLLRPSNLRGRGLRKRAPNCRCARIVLTMTDQPTGPFLDESNRRAPGWGRVAGWTAVGVLGIGMIVALLASTLGIDLKHGPWRIVDVVIGVIWIFAAGLWGLAVLRRVRDRKASA
jgi:hypothetical protein